MTFPPLPDTIDAVDVQRWETFQPYYDDLRERDLNATTVEQWLQDWSALSALIEEARAWIYIEKARDTADPEKEQAFLNLVNDVYPEVLVAEQDLKQRFLSLDAPPEELSLMWRHMRNEAELFREENVPLLTTLEKLGNEYDKITGALEAAWDGKTKNLSQLEALLRDKDRAVRERAWRLMMDLWLSRRQQLDAVYAEMLQLREQVAANAGLPDYRAYAFRSFARFDYTPEDCFTFHEAIAEVVVPAARRILEKRRQRLGVARLCPWDGIVEPGQRPPLQPYAEVAELIGRTSAIFRQVDPELGQQFQLLADESLLDLETRTGKALGGFCASLPLRKRPFIFMNGSGTHEDMQTLLHESGHAFHAFAAMQLPLFWQGERLPMEFAEVASMSMELLAGPYLRADRGGFYSEAEAARARIEHLEGVLLFFPYMAVVDAFQHWVYTHPRVAVDAAACDATWDELWQRFMPVIDWEGLEEERKTGWHRKIHIFQIPFYYVEYGMAQVGALQVWRNSLEDAEGALAAYRQALSLGGTRPLPELFATAGAEFRFDAELLGELVALVEETITALEATVDAPAVA